MKNTNKNSRLIILIVLVVYIWPVNGHVKQNDLIYILLWSAMEHEPWIYRDLEMGQEAFTSRNCSFQNCFVTANISFFNNLLDYDVVLLNAVDMTYLEDDFVLSRNRSAVQLYIMTAFETAAYYPLPQFLNGVFNLTWTYRLDSDMVNPFILVRNNIGEIIGPKLNMHWKNITDLPPIDGATMEKLKNKRLAGLWFASNCNSKDRLVYISKLDKELRAKYGHQIDVFGRCGDMSACWIGACSEKIESDYYFYLAFENSKCEDYVSEKVLHGLRNLAVPVVYGGANFTRFMPDGIYLDASKMEAEVLAKEMYDIINDRERYYDFFKWHGHYSFHDAVEDKYQQAVCEFCAFLNIRKHNRTVHVFEDILKWWNVPHPVDFKTADSFREYFPVISTWS